MTADQVKKIRDLAMKDDGTGHTLSAGLAAVFNNEISFDNTIHYVIYDDENKLVHAIQPNTNNVPDSVIAPYKINTGFYDNIQYMEAIYNMANFKTAVKELFLDTKLINQDQYDMIIKWAGQIRNTIPDAKPVYYDKTPIGTAHIPVQTPREDRMIRAGGIGPIGPKYELEKIIADFLADKGDNVTSAASSDTLILTKMDVDKVKTILKNFKNIMKADENVERLSAYTSLGTALYDRGPHGDEAYDNTVDAIVSDAMRRIDVKVVRKNVYVGFKIIVYEDYFDNMAKDLSALISRYMHSKNEVKLGSTPTEYICTMYSDSVDSFGMDSADKAFLDGFGGSVTYKDQDGNESTYEAKGTDEDFNNFNKAFINSIKKNPGEVTTGTFTLKKGGTMLTYTIKVTYVAPDQVTINGKSYHTLNEAIAAAEAGSTIDIADDFTSKDKVVFGKSMTLNIGDHNVNITDGITASGAGVELTINGDNGGITAGSGGDYTCITAEQGAKVTINGGNFNVGGDANDLGNSCVYVTGDANVVINGGTFATEKMYNGKYYVLNQNNSATGTFVVTGGTFVKYDPSTGDDHLKGNYVADGYISEKIGDNYVVRAMTDDEKHQQEVIKNETKAEETLDSFIDNISVDGFTIEKGEDNTYDVTTSQGSFDKTGLIDKFVASENLKSITVTDGDTVYTLNATDEASIAEFKANVDKLIPDEDGKTANLIFSLEF